MLWARWHFSFFDGIEARDFNHILWCSLFLVYSFSNIHRFSWFFIISLGLLRFCSLFWCHPGHLGICSHGEFGRWLVVFTALYWALLIFCGSQVPRDWNILDSRLLVIFTDFTGCFESRTGLLSTRRVAGILCVWSSLRVGY